MLNLNASTINSRDIIARLEELKDAKQDILDRVRDAETLIESTDDDELESLNSELEEWDDEYGDELASLTEINDEGESCSSEWTHGETLISSDYWVEYCKQLCEDIGDIPRGGFPSYIAIDWERTAENISADYTTVSINETEYYIRSC